MNHGRRMAVLRSPALGGCQAPDFCAQSTHQRASPERLEVVERTTASVDDPLLGPLDIIRLLRSDQQVQRRNLPSEVSNASCIGLTLATHQLPRKHGLYEVRVGGAAFPQIEDVGADGHHDIHSEAPIGGRDRAGATIWLSGNDHVMHNAG